MDAVHSRSKPPRRGAYLLPSAFTVANVFCGFFALTEAFKAGQLLSVDPQAASLHFDYAARAIGFAVLFDGLDGRMARLMGTTSAFGMELDSIADAITFGIAPAFLAYSWGVNAVLPPNVSAFEQLAAAGWLVSFLFVVSSVSRLARFNIQSTPSASHRSDSRKFVGLPTPAAAGLIAAIVHFGGGTQVSDWMWVPFWLVVMLGTSALMISTWRYHSFKDLDLRRKRKFVVVIAVAGLGALIYLYSQVVLLVIATTYVLSGIVVKLAHAFRRPRIEAQPKERQV
ncbi:MAG: phosphatidylcholine/phosphatidylserine synthase [Acidobacteria bacterium]|nr:phosphatidylcholine/phosphatidylserine synthase [Acidobacteriota bacterium]